MSEDLRPGSVQESQGPSRCDLIYIKPGSVSLTIITISAMDSFDMAFINIESAPAYYPVTEDNHAAWVVVVSLVLFICSALCVTAKIVIRFQIVSIQSYDYVLVVGTILLLIQTTIIVLACNAGLGQHQGSLSGDILERFNKVSKIHNETQPMKTQSNANEYGLLFSTTMRLPYSVPSSTVVLKPLFVCSSILSAFSVEFP